MSTLGSTVHAASLSGDCRRAPICRFLPHSAALQIRRTSLTAIRISVCAHHPSRSHNTEVGVCNVLRNKHLQKPTGFPTGRSCVVTSTCALNRHAPTSPDTPRGANRFLKALQPDRLRWGDLPLFNTEVGFERRRAGCIGRSLMRCPQHDQALDTSRFAVRPNRTIAQDGVPEHGSGAVAQCERLGGILSYYHRQAV